MADPPFRQPPPLPPLPLRSIATVPREPFQDLTAADRAAETQRSGSRAARDAIPPPPPAPPEDPLTETTAALLRQELALAREVLRDALPPVPAPPAPQQVQFSEPPKSRAQIAMKTAGAFGKWTTIAMGVLGLAATVAHQFRPDLEGPIQFFIKLLGGQP